MSKKLIATCQGEYLSDRGTDCGTKRGIKIHLDKRNINNYLYRYVMVNKKPVLIDNDNKEKFIDKDVELRSPMTCQKMQKDGGICNICAGEFYYYIQSKSIGLSASKIGTTLGRLNMKKFHDNVIHFSNIDVNDMFI